MRRGQSVHVVIGSDPTHDIIGIISNPGHGDSRRAEPGSQIMTTNSTITAPWSAASVDPLTATARPAQDMSPVLLHVANPCVNI